MYKIESNKSTASASSDTNSKSANPNQTSLFAKPPKTASNEKSDSVDDPNFEKQMVSHFVSFYSPI